MPERRPAPGTTEGGKLGRAARVRRRWEFNTIHKKGLRVHTHHFVVIAHETLVADGETARIGTAVSRKVGNAVTRNRLRRLIKEVFRRMADHLPLVDLVVIAKAHAGALGAGGFDAVAAELAPGFSKAAAKLMERET